MPGPVTGTWDAAVTDKGCREPGDKLTSKHDKQVGRVVCWKVRNRERIEKSWRRGLGSGWGQCLETFSVVAAGRGLVRVTSGA